MSGEQPPITCPGCKRRLWTDAGKPMPRVKPTIVRDNRGFAVARFDGSYDAGHGKLRSIVQNAVSCGSERCRQRVLLMDLKWPLRIPPP